MEFQGYNQNQQSTLAQKSTMLLDYAATYPNTVIRYHGSDLLLPVDSGVAYLTMPEAIIFYAGHFILVVVIHRGRLSLLQKETILSTQSAILFEIWCLRQQRLKLVQHSIIKKQLS